MSLYNAAVGHLGNMAARKDLQSISYPCEELAVNRDECKSIHTCVGVPACVGVGVGVPACVGVGVWVCLHVWVGVWVCLHVWVCVGVCLHVCVWVCVCMCEKCLQIKSSQCQYLIPAIPIGVCECCL